MFCKFGRAYKTIYLTLILFFPLPVIANFDHTHREDNCYNEEQNTAYNGGSNFLCETDSHYLDNSLTPPF